MLSTFLDRAGNRLKDVIDNVLLGGGNGGVHWVIVGPWDLFFDEHGFLEKRLHRWSGHMATVPEYEKVHASHKLEKPWSGMKNHFDRKTSYVYRWM